jgi:hypothetical protein
MTNPQDSLVAATPDQGRTVSVVLWRWVRGFRMAICRHEFRLSDLTDTNIAQPAKPPEGSGYYAWLDYYCGLSAHPANSERVKWACCKCGKEYRAHCGLDILNHGKIASPNTTMSNGSAAKNS